MDNIGWNYDKSWGTTGCSKIYQLGFTTLNEDFCLSSTVLPISFDQNFRFYGLDLDTNYGAAINLNKKTPQIK